MLKAEIFELKIIIQTKENELQAKSYRGSFEEFKY